MPEFLCAIKMRGGNNIIIGHVTRAWRNYSNHPEIWSPGSFPRTVSEFQKWWDLLEEPQESAFATVIAGGEGIFFTSVGDNFHFKASEMPVPIPQVRVVDFEMATSHDPAEYAKGEQALVSYDDSDGFQGAFNIPIARSTTTKVDQELVISEFTNWQRGRFQNSFPDLYRATRGLEPLSFEQIEAKLSEEASHSSDVFEVVGLKIPTEEVTTWGIILLLTVQLYLFLTLKELFSKLQPDDPGWETPWIGMYLSIFSRLLFFVSIALLPAITVGALVYEATARAIANSGPAWSWKLWTNHEWIVSLAIALSILLGALSWHYRPKTQLRLRHNRTIVTSNA